MRVCSRLKVSITVPIGPVTLFADDDLGPALVRRIGVVDLVAADEQDQVGVLLDGTGFAFWPAHV